MKNIEKSSMGFTEGMLFGMNVANSDFKQVDWAKAKIFIGNNKDNISSVSAGLAEDWEYTHGEVWNENEGYIKKEDTYVYPCSNWATPSLKIEYKDGSEETIECWIEGDDSNSYFEM